MSGCETDEYNNVTTVCFCSEDYCNSGHTLQAPLLNILALAWLTAFTRT